MKYLVFIGIIVIFFVSLSIMQIMRFFDGKFHVTVCDVGQGDAVIIRSPNNHTILFDGGPDSKVLDCLSASLPFWERKIDLVILSHPHADHLNGLIDIFQSYKVEQFATEALENKSEGFEVLQTIVRREGIAWQSLLDGDRVKLGDGVVLQVIGPRREYLSTTAIDGKYITSSEFASLEILVSYHDFDLLLTGDSQNEQLGDAVQTHRLPQIEILQTPHHGSKTGLTPEILERIRPRVATISVGKNTYGHPSPSTLDLLQKHHVTTYRTDKEGNLRLISDGKSYSIR